jgi:hypothetical protein
VGTPSAAAAVRGNWRWYPQAALGTRPLSEDGDLEWYVE